MDREKLIHGLECCLCDDTSACERCGYIDDGCLENPYAFKTAIMRDALELLKAQEPKPPIIKENSYGWKFYYCPSCEKEFYQNNKFGFCEKCGQAVKWE